MLPPELIRQLQVIHDEADVVSFVGEIVVKFVIAIAVFWIVLLGLGGWIMLLKRK